MLKVFLRNASAIVQVNREANAVWQFQNNGADQFLAQPRDEAGGDQQYLFLAQV